MNVPTLDRERLIMCRKKLGITKQDAARRLQLSQPAYLRYESGQRTPSIHLIYYMSHIFGTSVDYLTGNTDNPKPDSYVIDEKKEPDLFFLINAYHSFDANTQNRFMAYLRMISSQNNQ